MPDRQLRSATKAASTAGINFKASKAIKVPLRSNMKLHTDPSIKPEATENGTPKRSMRTKNAAAETASPVSAPVSRKRKLSVQITGKDEPSIPAKTKKVDVKVTTKKEKSAPKKSAAAPAKKKKSASVSLTQSPFPDYPHPTPDECQVVHDLLIKAHGPAGRPKQIRNPSTTISGCGEVPSVFDALMRTLLSANTSAANSNRALQGLLKTFGKDKTTGSVNWNAVRLAPQPKVADAIRSGGLANVKSAKILQIAKQVYEEGQESGNGFTLDYLHNATDDEVMEKLMGFNGIGVKTASCVLMFCLKRNLFPVDTHVFRISQLLGWVPTPASIREKKIAAEARGEPLKKRAAVTRDTTFLHLNATMPNELKYGIHQLLIRHGRYCPNCSARGGHQHGLGKHGRPLKQVEKEITVKEEKDDGTFSETKKTVLVKEEELESESEGVDGMGLVPNLSDIPIKGEETEEKPYVPVDAAGGTGERTGGKADGTCILGDLVSWDLMK